MGKIKRFKKFIQILLSLMVIFIPFGNIQKAFAFSGGYLDGVATTTGNKAATDNNDSTYIKLGGSHSGSPGSITYNLPRMETIQSYALNLSAQGCGADVKFLDSTGKVLYQKGIYSSSQTVTLTTPISGVTQIIVYFDTWLSDYYGFNLYEFNVFGPPHTDIANLALSTTGNDVNINYSIPTTSGYTGSKIYRDGTLIATQSNTANSYVDKSLSYGQSYTYKVTATYSDGFETTGASQNITIPKPASGEVSSLNTTAKLGEIDLTWNNPTDSFFSSVNIYRNDVKIGSTTGTTYKDTSVSPGTGYKYTVKTISTYGVESTGVSINTETPLDKLTKVTDSPEWNKINLSWTNPNEGTFAGVNIYRDGKLIATTTGKTSSYTDSNVIQQTLYSYKLVPYSNSNLEGEAVQFSSYTPIEPSPQIVGQTFTEQPNGDVLINWQQPTTGTVNVYVNGKLYKTVDASQLQSLVLAADVVKTTFGDYAITLQPISADGLVKGTMVQAPQLGGQQTPFSVNDLVGSGVDLLWYIAPLILLALTFLLVPKLRKLLFDSIRRIRGKEVIEQPRRTDQEPKEERQQREKQERHEGKEHLEKTGLLQRIGLSKQKETREEREQRAERQKRNKELKEITELAAKETREPRIRPYREEKGGRVQRLSKTFREPRERIRQARERQREPRQPRERTRQPRQPRGSRGDY